MNVTIIDCFDSFTYNLYQLVGSLGENPVAITCDQPLSRVEETEPDRIILSPGPGTPEHAGISADVVRRYAGIVPILGVCLGHQTIIHTLGGKIVRMKNPRHGKTSRIIHDGQGIFRGVRNPFVATRYHSLMADPETLPEELTVLATSEDDGCIMAVADPCMQITGLQFHPESIMSPDGRELMQNFLRTGGAL